ncbi:PEP-CTERM sorting domain-containing protein [Phycisphaera mikurensis]|uniref:PEP-CTERM protein-sorting domain-containing protein n=1 Tax=Phycisphaera mikurensis (strain NBRC 102666 / KCTC 22515 / FYK2301M01) TaxID=1142394 RepID=I0IC83_PHYMF|nr:PEP-CTERM sorting domain-containing protein [Phycisphaera mikurensis]MBB6441910.1 hypothetical protein [Phycisphaera mikurensis]BAM02871.1 hypothetical protein PSMK_07120 [Phycisphaera mikurensis NBRC 102666]
MTTLSTLSTRVALGAAAAVLAFPAAADGEGDGAPHVAVAQELTGELEIEYEVDAGLDESVTPVRLTLDTSAYSTLYAGFRTFPVNDTPSPNDDLGFVSEVEGVDEEGAALSESIGLRLLSKDADFAIFDGTTEILASPNATFSLGNAFDFHPVWVLRTQDQGFLGTSDASLEVFSEATGDSIGTFDVRLAVPEPTTAALFGIAGTLLLRRRRDARA